MPSAKPAGTHPAMINFAKSWPDRSEVNGTASGTPPGARTAVPMALNSRPPAGKRPMSIDALTTPCPPSAAHSADMRSIAWCRASYMVCTSALKEPMPPTPETEVTLR